MWKAHILIFGIFSNRLERGGMEIKVERNDTFDIAKALGIIFLVSSHAYWWPITRVFSTFYIALFCFITGYFLKIKERKLLEYTLGKVRNLYIPFVAVSMSYLVLHNFFNLIGITSGRYRIEDYVVKIKNIMLMNNSEQLLLPIWFVTMLFVITVLFGVLYKLLGKVEHKGAVLLGISVSLYCANAVISMVTILGGGVQV